MVRSWIRQALRASGVAILVPAAVAAALALSVVGGGHNLSSLGDVLRGPAVPPAEARGQSPSAPRAQKGSVPQRAERAKRGQTPKRGLVPERGLSPVRRVARRPEPRRPPPASTGPAPVAQAPAAPQPAPPPPPPPPAPKPHPIHDTGTAVAETVRPLPLAGPAAADAVEAVVNLVDPA